MELYASILSKEKCLEIAKIVYKDTMNVKALTEEELLSFLPDSIFGETWKVVKIDYCFDVFDDEYEWSVPTFFVKKASYDDSCEDADR